MSQFEQALDQYKKSFSEKLNRTDFNEDLLVAVAKSLGPSIYNKDAARVACSKKEERDLIKTKFLVGKLKLKDDGSLDDAITEICQTLGSSNRNKYRAVFYYLLVEKYSKESLYLKKETQNDTPISAEKTTPTEKPKASAATKKKSTSKEEDAKKEVPSSAKTTSSQDQKKEKRSSTTDHSIPTGDSEDIINKYALFAAGAGLVPIPLIDLAAITAVQYNMIKQLAHHYPHVKFDDKKAKSILASIIGGVSSFELGIMARILFKGIPFVGPIIGGTAVSGFAYASTKAIGEIFNDHFSSGGDMSIEELTAKKMKSTFKVNLKKR